MQAALSVSLVLPLAVLRLSVPERERTRTPMEPGAADTPGFCRRPCISAECTMMAEPGGSRLVAVRLAQHTARLWLYYGGEVFSPVVFSVWLY
jgi:hypothetical protein